MQQASSPCCISWSGGDASGSALPAWPAAGGVAAGAITLYICEGWLNVFGLPLDTDTRVWVVAAFGGVALALANLWRTRWRRRIAAVASVALFISTAALGINAAYGLDATLGALLGLNTTSHLALPTLDPKPAPLQPRDGKRGKRRGHAGVRPERFCDHPCHSVRLPCPGRPPVPAAGRAGPRPAGTPGPHHDDGPARRAWNRTNPRSGNSMLSARQNHGLAPITLTIDQLGNPFQNPACVDSDLGKVYTYVTKDVVNYIHRNLNVDRRRTEWAVGGYSNGGECALSFGAKRPDLFGSILDISGELKPLNGTEANTVSVIFKGNHAAFAAEEPANIMKARRYPDELAIFTSGSQDLVYGPQATVAAQDAKAAGMRTRSFVGSGVGHRGDALDFGVRTGLPLLCPRFGLTAP